MDRRERINDEEETLRVALDALQARLWTAMPGIVQSFDPETMTAVVQVALKAKVLDREGEETEVEIAPLLDCPVIFPSGGGFTLTFPVKKEDECLVVFAARCIDAWFQSGGIQSQAEFRMHDLSDGFVLVGPRSKVRALSGLSTTRVQLRNDNGDTYLEVTENQKLRLVAPGGVEITGNLTASGEIKSTLGGVHTLTQHTHPGVTTGGGNTDPPVG